jgi:chaperonin cofactor prefoldin
MSIKNEAAIKRLEVQAQSMQEQIIELKSMIQTVQPSPAKKGRK